MHQDDDANTSLSKASGGNGSSYGIVKKGGDFEITNDRPAGDDSKIPAVCWYILIVELCERLAFYSLAGSQESFLVHIGIPLAKAAGLNATMWTLCTVWAVPSSWIADVVLGRYGIILVAGWLYALGAGIAALAVRPSGENSSLYFVGVMGILPVATAGIKANLSNFGADQYDPTERGHEAKLERFFSMFYVSINIGAAVGFGFFTTLATSGAPGSGVEKEWGYFTAYSCMAGCMVVAVCVYLLGSRSYRLHPVQTNSSLGSVGRALFGAVLGGSIRASLAVFGWLLLFISIVLSVLGAFQESDWEMMIFGFLCAFVGTTLVVRLCQDPVWLETAALTGVAPDEIAEVQQFFRLLPALFTGSIAFNALYNSMQFWYQQQACQMDVRIPFSSSQMQLSGSFFNIADCLAIVTMTPLILGVLNPALENYLGHSLGTSSKFGIGMAIAGLSVLCAMQIEIDRRAALVLPIESNCAPPGVMMSDYPASWIVVPYFLMGVGEIYSQPTLLHYAYSKSPPRMRALSAAMYFFIAAVSSSLFALLTVALKNDIPNDLNKGHLEHGYAANLIMGGVIYVVFLMTLRS